MSDKRYGGEPKKIHASYWKEIKDWSSIKYTDARAYCQFFSFLNKSDSVPDGINWSTKDISEFFVCWYPNVHFLSQTYETEEFFHSKEAVNKRHFWKTYYNSLMKKLLWPVTQSFIEKLSVNMWNVQQ